MDQPAREPFDGGIGLGTVSVGGEVRACECRRRVRSRAVEVEIKRMDHFYSPVLVVHLRRDQCRVMPRQLLQMLVSVIYLSKYMPEAQRSRFRATGARNVFMRRRLRVFP